jgi:hypothetical protein
MPGAAKSKTSARPNEKPPVRERARAFAFEGLPEKDRFGIFDPALRAFFFLGVMFGVVFGIGFVLAAAGAGPLGWAVGAALALFVVAGGAWGYRRIWRKPSERELLLALAREDDEARALAAKLSRPGPSPTASGHEPNGERAHE